jgi:hypothetical protein
MSIDSVLRQKLTQFSVRPAGGDCAPATNETIVLAQAGDSLDVAFRIARELLDRGLAVRIIGLGVTLSRTWPAWAKGAHNLTLTEWGAFRAGSQPDETLDLQDEIRAWIRDAFGRELGGQPADRVFFAAACQRFFHQLITAYPIARAIARTFPEATVHPVRPDGLTAALVQQLIAGTGGRVEGISTRARRWPARRFQVLGLGIAGMIASVMRVTRAFLEAAPTFRGLRAHRRSASGPVPDTWVGVMPDWYRANHHLLDAFALPETESGGRLGVLFIGTLAPFERDEQNQRTHHASKLWPGLGKLNERLGQCVVEQAVMPETPLAFARATATGLSRSARAVWRLSSAAEVRLPSARFSPYPRDVLTWATFDVLRATLAEAATTTLLGRLPMRGKTILFIAGNNVGWTPVDLAVQAAGATTVDHPHGTSDDMWTASAASTCSVRLFWTRPDKASARAPGVHVNSGMPIRMRFPPRARRPRRILIASSYAHRDQDVFFGFPVRGGPQRYPLSVYQREMLGIIPILRERSRDGGLEFRWRPHPADNEIETRAAFSECTGVELSRGRSLEEDAEWADIILSSSSTLVIETMFAGVPVFVHALPELWSIPATSFVAPGRIFFYAEDGARHIANWIDRFGADPSEGLEPERRARALLFGESLEPVPMTAYFGRHRTRPLEWTDTPEVRSSGDELRANGAVQRSTA